MKMFETVLWVLLLGPPAAWLVLLAARRLGAGASRALLAAAAVLVALPVLACWLGIGFRDGAANLVVLCATYLAYAVLAFAAPRAADLPAFRRRPTALAVMLFAAFTPMAAGYFLGTVGALGVAFLVGDAAAPPLARVIRADGLVCEVRRESGGPSADGYHHALYREWPPLPLRWRVAVSPSTREPDLGCTAGRRSS